MSRWLSLVVLAGVSFGLVGCQEQKPAAPQQATDPMEMQKKMMEGMKGMGPSAQQLEQAKAAGLDTTGAPGTEAAKEEAAAEPAKEEAAGSKTAAARRSVRIKARSLFQTPCLLIARGISPRQSQANFRKFSSGKSRPDLLTPAASPGPAGM